MKKPATKLDAKQLRVSKPSSQEISKIKRREIYIICDNILDTYNIGSIFRLADAVVAKKIYLCGQTETPPNSRISKASVGTDKWVPWQYIASAQGAIEYLKKKFSTRSNNKHAHLRGVLRSDMAHLGGEVRLKVVAIEQSPKSIDYRSVKFQEPVAFVIGHETSGVSKEALALCDQIVEIPMFGVNRSLNVMVSLAIVLYKSL